MYRYNVSARPWVAVTPTAFPTCVNDGHLIFASAPARLAFFGGVCASDTPPAEEVWEWDNAGTGRSSRSRRVPRASRLRPFPTTRCATRSSPSAGPRHSAATGSQTYILRATAGARLPHSAPESALAGRFPDRRHHQHDLAPRRSRRNELRSITPISGATGTVSGSWRRRHARRVRQSADGFRYRSQPPGRQLQRRGHFEWDGTDWKSFPDLKKQAAGSRASPRWSTTRN